LVALHEAGGSIACTEADLPSGHVQTVGFSPENNGLEKALEGAEIVVIPAGMPPKPGMTRDDLFNVSRRTERVTCPSSSWPGWLTPAPPPILLVVAVERVHHP